MQEKHKSELVQLRKVAQAEAAQAHARLEAKEDVIEDLQAKVTTQSRELEVCLNSLLYSVQHDPILSIAPFGLCAIVVAPTFSLSTLDV